MQIKFEGILLVDDELILNEEEYNDERVERLIQNIQLTEIKVSAKTNDMKRFKDSGISLENVKEICKDLKETI